MNDETAHGPSKHRLVVLTDIKRGLENDDIQSMARLLLYANVIDIEGLIAVSSCWHRRGGRARDAAIIHSLIDAYSSVKHNLDAHATGYPDPALLHSRTFVGVPAYGNAPGDGFAEQRFSQNPGVQAILQILEDPDPRPVWFALWAGANTLAQALWIAEQTYTDRAFERLLGRLRIYAISDQDAAGHWLRDVYGERLFYIVSPSPASGGRFYRHATWPGISADRFSHGSEDGIRGGGFTGADRRLVSRRWLHRHIRRGSYGHRYPLHRFIMEGDTPSFLSLIPNGLNDPNRPDWGGWGGRYRRYIPDSAYAGRDETYPIWTNAADTVLGSDGNKHHSPQATIWRWRSEFQHDFAGRIAWTLTDNFADANHPPIARLAHHDNFTVVSGEKIELDASPSSDPDGDQLEFRWFFYAEAGDCPQPPHLTGADTPTASFTAPTTDVACELHVILRVTDTGTPPMSAYRRVRVRVEPLPK
ncbi:DUF1593 domain-containing protein [Nocardia cerradoensis]|uniref:DUF1593 domain-containing protein n=1 Tax=Nocardia cerradoensis TaxID=85688 RepID=A0A231GU05_9NOCA|nr:DUF1593 domain-containing protein [Nocardia cerradoensis]NKY43736.1 DUF1593 domain-containing protein [Nocardia cerradoensis]OXR40100.1 hypothetical protein B7C42_07808 [Nocardia cerradoensis]